MATELKKFTNRTKYCINLIIISFTNRNDKRIFQDFFLEKDDKKLMFSKYLFIFFIIEQVKFFINR